MPSRTSARKTKVRAESQVERWWLGGEEQCPHCGQLYAYEVEFRCPDCDGPSCPHCIVHHRARRVCLDCAPDVQRGR